MSADCRVAFVSGASARALASAADGTRPDSSRRVASVVLALAFAWLAWGCGDDRSAKLASAPGAGQSSAVQAPAQAPVQEPDRVAIVREIVRIGTGPGGKTPARITHIVPAPDGSARLYVVDIDGPVHIVDNGTLLPEPLLDMTRLREKAFVHGDQEIGLTSMAFHPDFAVSGAPGFGRLYTASSEAPTSGTAQFPTPDPAGGVSHHDVITEWRVLSNDPSRVDPASRREILRIAHPSRDHTIGQIAFNPTVRTGEPDYGLLYVGVGDGGNTVPRLKQTDAFRTAQNGRVPFGKILRINPLGDGTKPYTIPADNPWANDPAHLGEIWAVGLRNPQRFSWDAAGAHRLYIADVGQAQVEEIDIGVPGANYGWSEREGDFVTRHDDETSLAPLPRDDSAKGYTYPAIQYRHDRGKAITGGFVYRGRLLPELVGKYVFADLADGRLYYVDALPLRSGHPAPFAELKLKQDGTPRTSLELVGGPRADLRLGRDALGELYLLTKADGVIRKLSMMSP